MTSVETLHDLCVASQARATEQLAYNGKKPTYRFLVKDKHAIIHMFKGLLKTTEEVCAYFSTRGLEYGTWRTRFYNWGRDYDSGKLDVMQAVAVQRKKPTTYLTNPMHEVIAKMAFTDGRTLADIESCFAIALGRVRDDLTKAAVDSVETILKSKGLTLDDLKKAL